MKKEILTPGDGKTFPKIGDMVRVHYVGTVRFLSESDSTFAFLIYFFYILVVGWPQVRQFA